MTEEMNQVLNKSVIGDYELQNMSPIQSVNGSNSKQANSTFNLSYKILGNTSKYVLKYSSLSS
jgi:hypothetical protein